ncbi:lysozyme inhibitor LprI family protein [Roseibium sp.]
MIRALPLLAVPTVLAASLVLAAVTFTGARAQENIDCGYPLDDSQRSYCADKALEDAGTKMREAYELLAERVSELDAALPAALKGAPAALKEAQAAWETYAGKDCKAYAFPFMGGPGGSDAYRNCLIVLTVKRTDDLTATVEDYSN